MKTSVLLLFLVVACTPSTGELGTSPDTVSSTSTPAGTTETGPLTSAPGSTATSTASETVTPDDFVVEFFPVPDGSHPHDVAPAADGGVWYTAQGLGELGWLDPVTGETVHIPLGALSRPHGVIVAADGTPWITDSGLNSIISVDPETYEVTVYPLPDSNPANLNTAVFDDNGMLWFTGQAGLVGSLDPATGETEIFLSPRGPGPYGITAIGGRVFFASLAGSYVGEILENGDVDVVEPPTAGQGARRVWADSSGSIWVSEWNSGNVSRLDPQSRQWDTWALPGDNPATYAVYVDEADIVWLSDFGANALVRFDPESEVFNVYALPHDPGEVRQIHGRPGEVWGAESAADHLVLIRTR